MSEWMWWLPWNDAAVSCEKCLPYDSCAAGRGVQHIFIIKVMNLIANWQPNGNCRPWYWEKIAYKATPERAGFKFIHPFRHWGEHRNCRIFCLGCLVQMDDTLVFLYLRTSYSVAFFFKQNLTFLLKLYTASILEKSIPLFVWCLLLLEGRT